MDKRNYDFKLLLACAKFLNSNFEKTVTEDVLKIMSSGVDDQFAVSVLIAEGGGIDTFIKDRGFFNQYFPLCVKKLRTSDYEQNPYYKNVLLKTAKDGEIELCYEKYRPYEPFVYDDLTEDFKGMIIPKIGFFEKEFIYPAVKEKGVLWMSVTPNEINTMQAPIENASGKVLTLGLGLGYFAYMCSIKPSVEKVTVIEINKKVINLFKKYILPQFPNPEKIEIINADGVEYFKNPTSTDYDFIFCDLWHDVSDGIPLVEKLKPHQSNFKKAKITYWIENSMKYYL